MECRLDRRDVVVMTLNDPQGHFLLLETFSNTLSRIAATGCCRREVTVSQIMVAKAFI